MLTSGEWRNVNRLMPQLRIICSIFLSTSSFAAWIHLKSRSVNGSLAARLDRTRRHLPTVLFQMAACYVRLLYIYNDCFPQAWLHLHYDGLDRQSSWFLLRLCPFGSSHVARPTKLRSRHARLVSLPDLLSTHRTITLLLMVSASWLRRFWQLWTNRNHQTVTASG